MKELVMEITNQMPDNASLSETLDAIIVRLSATKGFKEIDNGKYTTQEELLHEINNCK